MTSQQLVFTITRLAYWLPDSWQRYSRMQQYHWHVAHIVVWTTSVAFVSTFSPTMRPCTSWQPKPTNYYNRQKIPKVSSNWVEHPVVTMLGESLIYHCDSVEEVGKHGKEQCTVLRGCTVVARGTRDRSVVLWSATAMFWVQLKN